MLRILTNRQPLTASSDQIPIIIALEADRRPVIQAHAQRKPVALEHFLDLGE